MRTAPSATLTSDASTDHLWPVAYLCIGNDDNIYDASITSRDHKTTDVELSAWNIGQSDSVNHRFPIDIFSFFYLYKRSLGRLFDLIFLIKYKSHSNRDSDEIKQYYQQGEINITQFSGNECSSCSCGMLPFNIDEIIMRRSSYVISTCASDWADREVEAMYFAYTDYYCNGTDYFRNPHCALCNHVGLFETQNCTDFLAGNEDVGLSGLLDLDKIGTMKPNPDEQNTTIIPGDNDGKLIFSYEYD